MKVLLVVNDFQIGGITTSLKNLCNELISRGNSVDILNLPKVKELPEGFDSGIGKIELSGKERYWNFGADDLINSPLGLKIPFAVLGMFKKLLNSKGRWCQYIFNRMPIMDTYDVAIAFRQEPVGYYIVANKTASARKIGFWHGDPDYMGDLSSWDKCVYEMDKIAGVSDAVCDSMLRHYPGLKGKLETVYNIFDAGSIKKRAEIFDPKYSGRVFNIVTASRIEIDSSKCLRRIPEICQRLAEAGIAFHWTVVGGGNELDDYKAMIAEVGLSEAITLAGAQNNPYPYIKAADLFVLTSKTESYGMVVMESLILGTPVVAGDYPALKEILLDDYGIRADNSVDGIYEAVKRMITDQGEYRIKKKNCMNFVYSTETTYQQFLDLCGEQNA